jgi:hypothetical protein
MNAGAFMFLVLAILSTGLLVFSYTKTGKKVFNLDVTEEED